MDKERCEADVLRNLPSGSGRRKLIMCRQGSPLNLADLAKVNVSEAARVVVLAPEHLGNRAGFRYLL